MPSATKRHLTEAQVLALVQHGLGPQVSVVKQAELADGAFSAVYAVTLADGEELVLKAAPEPGFKLLRYEVDLLHIEIEFYRRSAEVALPMPRLRAADLDLGYLLLDRLAGQSLAAAAPSMAPAQLASVRQELGRHCALLAGVTGDQFGYPRRDGHTRSSSWRSSFLAMIDDILADAVEYQRELPAPAARISELIRAHAPLLDDVTVPVLVHFDLWDGNVFVVPAAAGYRVEGIIDGERAFYGDPLAELVSLALLRDPAEVPGLLPGFLGRPLTGRERARLRLYTCYLYLIMVTEGATRGFDPVEHEPLRLLVLDKLRAELAALGGAWRERGRRAVAH